MQRSPGERQEIDTLLFLLFLLKLFSIFHSSAECLFHLPLLYSVSSVLI